MALASPSKASNQLDLFGTGGDTAGPPSPERKRKRREAQPEPAPAPAAEAPAVAPPAVSSEVTLLSFAAAVSHPDLAAFVEALADEDLALLAVDGVREIVRRQGGARGRRSSGRSSALERALRLIAAELGGSDG
jgi:hypothetical protein